MKARKIELKKIANIDPFTNTIILDENGKETDFNYREQLWNLLSSVNRGNNVSTSELIKRAQIQFLLQTINDNESIYLPQDQYDILINVINDTKWLAVNPYVADMIKSIQEAEEVELEPKTEIT